MAINTFSDYPEPGGRMNNYIPASELKTLVDAGIITQAEARALLIDSLPAFAKIVAQKADKSA